MSDDPRDPARFSWRRWSQRKREAARNDDRRPQETAPAPETPRGAQPGAPARGDGAPGPAERGSPPLAPAGNEPAAIDGSAAGGAGAATQPQRVETALPPLDSLTIDSDFSPFLRPGVDVDVKRVALRKLFRDPRFNVMDGLDVYIDDYSKPSPIEPELARTLMQARYLFDPPKTRVNARGEVEDVPDEPNAADAGAAPLAQAADADAAPPAQAADAGAAPADGSAQAGAARRAPSADAGAAQAAPPDAEREQQAPWRLPLAPKAPKGEPA